jgi:GTP-binding protein
MTKYSFKYPKFIKTAMKLKDYPTLRDLSGNILFEIAVAGRSNVGKSSLLNHLFMSKGLVKTSATPGKTQAINFFTLNDQLAFVDLPGYGFAKVSHDIRKQWGPMIQTYLKNREPLKIILMLFDIRRMPNEEDCELMEWIAQNQKALK